MNDPVIHRYRSSENQNILSKLIYETIVDKTGVEIDQKATLLELKLILNHNILEWKKSGIVVKPHDQTNIKKYVTNLNKKTLGYMVTQILRSIKSQIPEQPQQSLQQPSVSRSNEYGDQYNGRGVSESVDRGLNRDEDGEAERSRYINETEWSKMTENRRIDLMDKYQQGEQLKRNQNNQNNQMENKKIDWTNLPPQLVDQNDLKRAEYLEKQDPVKTFEMIEQTRKVDTIIQPPNQRALMEFAQKSGKRVEELQNDILKQPATYDNTRAPEAHVQNNRQDLDVVNKIIGNENKEIQTKLKPLLNHKQYNDNSQMQQTHPKSQIGVYNNELLAQDNGIDSTSIHTSQRMNEMNETNETNGSNEVNGQTNSDVEPMVNIQTEPIHPKIHPRGVESINTSSNNSNKGGFVNNGGEGVGGGHLGKIQDGRLNDGIPFDILQRDFIPEWSRFNKVRTRRIPKYRFIDSRDRNHDHYPNPNQYKIDLFPPYKDVVSVELQYAEIPASGYLVNNYNNLIYFGETSLAETDPSERLIATVAIGNYTPEDLALAVKIALDSAGDSTYTVTIDSITNKMTIMSDLSGGDGSFSLFFVGQEEKWGFDGTRSTYLPKSIGGIIGFDRVDLMGSDSYVGGGVVKTVGENYILMIINELERVDSNARTPDRAFARIPLNTLGETVTIAFFEGNNSTQIKYFSPPMAKLSSLSIEFRNYDGSPYDFNGCEHAFALEIVQLENEDRLF